MKLCLTPVTINYIIVTTCNRLGLGKHYAANIEILIQIRFCEDTRDFCSARGKWAG